MKLKFVFSLVAGLIGYTVLFGSVARATPSDLYESLRARDFIEVDVFTGPTQLTGGFTQQKNPNGFGFSANIYLIPKSEASFPSFISVGNYNFYTVSNDPNFNFPLDDAVSFSTNHMSILLSIYEIHNVGLYLGVGYSIISLINDTKGKYSQNYGSQLYELQARYSLNEKWGINYKSKWQQINQYQNSQFSFIEMWSHFVGVSYLIY